MTEENLHNEAEIRRFLLGEMPEDRRIAFEEEFITNERLFEQMRVVEDELIESYIRETLSAAEAKNFERSFLLTEARRRRVAFVRTMLDKLAGQTVVAEENKTAEHSSSVWDSIANFLKTPKLAFGTAFAVLVLIFGGWLLLRNSNQPEIVQHITPTPTIEIKSPNQNQNSVANQIVSPNVNANISETNQANKIISPNANRELPNKNQNSIAPKPDSTGIAPVLALFAGAVRGEGKMPELNLPKNAPGANLQLNLESQDYKIYSVEIVNPDGNLIFRSGRLIARNRKTNFFVPATKLLQGDYLVKLSAVNPQNETESVADYSFRVTRK